jgi:hypothetical protein
MRIMIYVNRIYVFILASLFLISCKSYQNSEVCTNREELVYCNVIIGDKKYNLWTQSQYVDFYEKEYHCKISIIDTLACGRSVKVRKMIEVYQLMTSPFIPITHKGVLSRVFLLSINGFSECWLWVPCDSDSAFGHLPNIKAIEVPYNFNHDHLSFPLPTTGDWP